VGCSVVHHLWLSGSGNGFKMTYKHNVVFLLLNYVFLNNYGGTIRDVASLNILKNMVTEEVSLVFSIKKCNFAQNNGYHGE
jgi:hypothetical protein